MGSGRDTGKARVWPVACLFQETEEGGTAGWKVRGDSHSGSSGLLLYGVRAGEKKAGDLQVQ